MDVIKTELEEQDPLAIDNTDLEDKKPESQEWNLSHLEAMAMKTECVDYSYDIKTEIKVEDTPVPISFPMVKTEVDHQWWDLDEVKAEVKLEVMAEENEVSTESFAVTQNSSVSSEYNSIKHEEPEDSSSMCNICHKNFSNPFTLKYHLRTHAGESHSEWLSFEKLFKCDVCGKCFADSVHLTRHECLHTGEKPFKCDFCGKCFSQYVNLRRHAVKHQSETPFKCDVCVKSFSQSGDLKRHVRLHTGEKPFKCDICGKYFAQPGHLTTHARKHTGEKPFRCGECGKCFSESSNLRRHELQHSGEKPFKCDVCGECFSYNITLKRHSLKHTMVKTFECDFCKKCFTESKDFKMHRCLETGERAFKCKFCDKNFLNPRQLTTHEYQHTADKPYKCDICGECFPYSINLNRHSLKHAIETPVKCDVCGKSFMQSGHLKRHQRLHTVAMDVIKTEIQVDPLAVQTDVGEKKHFAEGGNLLGPEETGIKAEYMDHSYDLTSEMKVEATPLPFHLEMVKCEAEDESPDWQTLETEVKAEGDEVLTER
ncbi:zinc finger protein ZFP2-like [Periplaneta americana]|uniref:zinc finger protein ZFP2-like n=1 Tax=Periplaneta americana TaxID=6978 RepID=UPI0037E79CFE